MPALIALPSPLAPLSRLLLPFVPAVVQEAWPRAVQSRLAPCLLLALLLHVWLVLMLGNAPPGTALPGQGVWGALNVTLRGAAQDAAVAMAAPPAQAAGLPGTAASPRAGGTVRAPATQPLPEPGAALRGDWAATPPLVPAPDSPAAAEPAPEPARLPAPAALAQPALPQPLPKPTPRPAVPAPVAAPAPAPAPVPVPVPVPVPAPAPAPAPVPVPAPAPPAVAVRPAPPVAVATPAVAAEPVAAAPVLRQIAPMAAAAAPAPALAPVQSQAAQAPVGLPSLPAAPAGVPAAALPAGRPDAGPQVGHDVATAPSAPASAPRLNLELARPRAGELSRQGATGVLQLLPRPPELPDKLSRDIDKAAKVDCRKAYQDLGLLAVVPLAADALRGSKDSGCKW